MRVENLSDALKQFFAPLNVVMVDDLDAASEMARRGRTAADVHTQSVQALMAHSNPILSKLGHRIWDVFHYRIVHTSLTEMVKTPHFGAFKRGDGSQQAVVFMPVDWTEMVTKEPVMQFGAVIFTGSQAVDFYNGRIGIDATERIQARACAYEAEMLKDVRRALLNKYQRRVLKNYPNGFEPRLAYAYGDVQQNRA